MTPSAEMWLGCCSLNHLLEWRKLYQQRIFLCSTSMLSRTLASRALLVSGKPTICPIFLDVLSPTAQEFCPDEFRGTSTLVCGSHICDISTCGVPDVVGLLQSQTFTGHVCSGLRSSQKSPDSYMPHVTQAITSPATT